MCRYTTVALASILLTACEKPAPEFKLPSGEWACSTGVLNRGSEEKVNFSLKIDSGRFSFPNGDPTYKQKSIARKGGKQPQHSGVLKVGPSRAFDKNINPPMGSRTHVVLLNNDTPTQSNWFYVEYNGSRPAEILYLDKAILSDPPPDDNIIRSASCKLG